MGTISTHRRLGSILLAAALTGAFLVLPSSSPAYAASPTLLTSESFNTNTVADPNWKTGGTNYSACLTASTNTTQSPIPGCANGAVGLPSGGDPLLNGTLRLTENVGNQVGYGLYDVALPFTKGLQVTFDQYQYAGSAADGIGFFLADGAATTFAPGQPGGSFGYAQRSGLVGTPSGYLGLAIDAYGNFANDGENRGTNCTATEGISPHSGRRADTVTLRGPGSGLNKYCWLATSATMSPSLRTAGPTRTAAGTKQGMRITIDPATNKVTVDRNLGSGYVNVLTTNMPPAPPSTVKFGFIASTGGSTDIHEIDNVSITSLEQLAALHATIAPASPSYVSGGTGTLNIGVDSIATEGAGNLPVKVKSTLPAGVTMSSVPTGTGWNCAASAGQNVSCVRSTAPFYYAAGTTFPTIDVPVSFASTYSTSTIGISATAYADDAAPDYATGVVVVTPVAVADAYPAVGGAATAMDVTSNDRGTLDKTKVTITSPSANGTTSVNATTGVVTFTSLPGFSGVTTFTYQVKDTSGQATTAVATVTVAPKAYADAVGTTVNTAVTHNPLTNDFGNFTVGSLTVTTAPTHGTTSVSGGQITYTPTANYSGTDTLTYRITDGSTNVTAVVTYTIAPTAGNDADTTPVNVPKQITVLANDTGSLTAGSVTVTTAPGHGTTSVSSGKITYTPTSEWSGVDTFVYRVSDGTTPVFATVTVTVTPTAANDTATINANATATTSVLANDHGSLAPGSVSVTTAPGHGTTSVNATTGAVTYTPTTGWSGTDTYTYTATDGAGQPVSATVTVTVNPTAAADTHTRSVTAAGPITFTPLSNDVGSLSNSTFAFNGATVFTTWSWDAATGTLTVTQPGGATASGTWTQGYRICDTAGRCATSTFTLTVTPLAVADSATAAYNTPVGVSVLGNDAGSMTNASLTVTGAPSHGTTSVNPTTGVITYTPAVNWSGVDTYTYRGSDGTTTSSAVVTVTTNPRATADTATTTGRTPVSVSVLANDRGTLVTTSVAVTVAPTVGSAVANADGTITYTAPGGFSGSAGFTYSVTDGNGTVATAVVTVTVNPDAKNDTATTPAGTAVTANVLANDDATPNPATVAVTAFAHGTRTVNLTTGAVTYTPAANWSGDDTATVSYQDTSGRSTSSTLTVTTTPIAGDDSVTTAEHTAVTVPVLGNDNGAFVASTVAVPATGPGHPAHGTTSVNPTTGAITYTPTAEFSGIDTFTYSAKDGANRTATATVTVTVTPQLTDDTATTTSVASVDVSVLANDHGSLDASTLTAPATSTQGGSVQIVSGKLRYTPLHTFSGSDTVTYTVTDAASQTRSATLTVTVTPVATDDVATASAISPHVTTDVVDNDNGDLDRTTVSITSAPAHGTTSIDAVTGAITFHGAAGWSGKTVLTYRVCDRAAQCTTAQLDLTITPVAGPVAATTPADTAVAIDPDADQTGDFDGTTVAVATAPIHGTVSVHPVTGVLTYTPSTGWSGTDTFTYTIEDLDGQAITVTASVVVTPTATNDSALTPVDVPVDIDVLGNDAGTYIAVNAPAIGQSSGTTPHGSVSVNPDRTLHYTPNAGFSGTDTVTYLARDAEGRTAAAIVTVTVAPTATADSATSAGHASVALDVLDNDHGSFVPSTVTVPSSGPDAPAHGTVTIDPTDGAIAYTPGADWSGTDTFTYTACDATSQCATATVTVITLPESADDTATTTAGAPVTTPVLGNDHGSLDAATVAVTTAAGHGTTAVNTTTGAVTYVPAAGWSGDDSYEYTVTDSEGRTASATVTVTVAPVASADSGSTDAGTAVTVDVLANDHGTFGPSAVTVKTAPAHGTTSVDPANGEVTYTPADGWSGEDTFVYEACDAAARCATATVSLTITPTAGDDDATTGVNHAVSVDVLANDHGTLDPSTVTVLTAPQHGTTTVGSGTGGITYTPTTDWSGNDLLVYEVCDAAAHCATATLTLHVTPAAAADHGTTQANVAVVVDVLANDRGTLATGSVTVASAPAHGTTTVNGSTGAITYTPSSNWSGTDTFTYTASDGAGATATATVTVDVTPVGADDDATTTANQAIGVDVLANDAGSLVVTGVAVSSPPAHGTTSVDAVTGAVTYTPANDWSGDDSFEYDACDAQSRCTTAQVFVHVTPVADDDSSTTTANQAVDVDVRSNDHGTLDATTVTVSAPPAHGATSVDPVTGVVTYTPDAGWSGPDSFGYVVSDAAGRTTSAIVTIGTGVVADDDTVLTDADQDVSIDVLGNDHGVLDPASVTVTVDPAFGATSVDTATGAITYHPSADWSGDDAFSYRVCDAVPTCAIAGVSVVVRPTATDDSTSTDPGTAVTTDVLANDHGSLDASTVAITDGPDHGTATVDPTTGAVTYTPGLSFSGTDQLTYTVTDSSGRVATADLTVEVGLVAKADSATTPVDTAVTFGVLGNDHGTPDPTTVSIVTAPLHGALVVHADGTLTYTPTTGWSGTEHLRYRVCDGASNCAEADLTVVVTPVADADGTDTDTVAGSPVVVDVLGNDHGSLDPATVTVTVAPAHGSTAVDPTTGKVTYTPDDDWSGDDAFTYEACDSTPTCVTAVVTVHVAPTSSDDMATTAAGHAVVIDVEHNDHGTLDPSTTSIVSAPTHGTTSIDTATGNITYTPEAGWSGTDTFRYELCDEADRCTSASVTIHVAPTAGDDQATLKTGNGVTEVEIDTRANDVGSYGPSAVTITADPAHGIATVDEDGVVTYVPDAGYLGTDTIGYTTCDVNGDCVSAEITISVEGLTVTASARCVRDTPYVDYSVSTVASTPTLTDRVSISWLKEDGTVVSTLNGQRTGGSLLWPGTKLDANGDAVAWPGWEQRADGSWVRVEDGLRPNLKLKFSMGSSSSVTVAYPRATANCSAAPHLAADDDNSAAPPTKAPSDNNAPVGTAPGALAHTGSNLLSAAQLGLSLLFVGFVLMAVGRRRASKR